MHLTVFQSGKGDCLLLADAADGARMLVDGGMPDAYRDHVADAIGKLRKAGKKLDVVYVSHIDEDHIGGILRMLDDEVDWQVHAFQKKNGNPKHKPPEAARPPEIGEIWHNAFHEQLKKNAGPVEEALAAIAPVISGADLAGLREAGRRQGELATSIRQAIQVSRRIGTKQLGIPLNRPAGGKLLMRRDGQKPIRVGGLSVTVLGPTNADLVRLRKDWNKWLQDNQDKLKVLRDTARREEERLGASEFDRFVSTLRLQAEAFGNPASVTPPNLASLTLLVEEDGQSILLTGDARGDQIVDGLRAAGRLDGEATFTVDVLKVPHHGSENNVNREFCDTVIASDYVFCGNGEHANPDLRVVELLAKRRLATADGRFRFWFSSSQALAGKAEAADHMAEVETLVARLVKSSKGRMAARFLEKGGSLRVV